jgi:hypothetical protein
MSNGNGAADRPSSSARDRARRLRFRIELVIAGAATLLGLLTLVWPDWIEGVFGVEPDGHSGGLEWLVVVALVGVAALMAGAARFEWRRLQPALHSPTG